jgi:hypothetical protein
MSSLGAYKAHLTRLQRRVEAETGLDGKIAALKARIATLAGSAGPTSAKPGVVGETRLDKKRRIGALAANGGTGFEIEQRFRECSASLIRLAKERQRKNAAKGKPHVAVTLTVPQLMAKFKAQQYRCALTALPFWSGDGGSYGPTIPTLDRIKPEGGYSAANVRVVFLGINSLRGHGSDAQMYAIAKALLAHRHGLTKECLRDGGCP